MNYFHPHLLSNSHPRVSGLVIPFPRDFYLGNPVTCSPLQLRLTAGFLSTGDSNAPGNYALLDQVAALHWVKENIRAFDGDPDDVTLIGHGHGAALVNLLMISPVTKGETKQGIFNDALNVQ